MTSLDLQEVITSSIHSNIFQNYDIDVLRTDLIHPVVSGNKWYKLKLHIEEAKKMGKNTIATFGGAYSNHILATAFACKVFGMDSVGIIRGEKPAQLSHTLQAAQQYGMLLHFVSRYVYDDKEGLKKYFNSDCFWVNEGGFSELGMLGAADILKECDNPEKYSHIVCSCGTGTMIAGLLHVAKEHQQVIGISALKSHTGLESDVLKLLPSHQQKQPVIFHNYHFGGYAKHPPELINWMNLLWQEVQIPTDIVYSSKLFFAVKDLIEQQYFKPNDKILIIHCGGLQGNLSLPANTLNF